MADDRSASHTYSLRHLFPWLDILRATNLAFNPGKVLLGAFGALLLAAGWWLLGYPFAPTGDKAPEPNAFLVNEMRKFPWEPSIISQSDMYESVVQKFGSKDWCSSGYSVFEPVLRYITPFRLIFSNSGYVGYGLLCAVWTLIVAAFVGGAISRMTALEFARDSTVGLGDAVRFSLKHLRGYIMGPTLPLAGALIIFLCCLIGGLLARIPVFDVIMGALWFLALLGGALMALALLGLAVIWPLMFPAISVEGTEGVDALTRGYSYLIGRPWNYFFYWLVAIINGAAAMIIAVAFGYATLKLSFLAVSWGMGEENAKMAYAYAPLNGEWRDSLAGTMEPTGSKAVLAVFVGFWTHLVFMGVVGFAYSYFWTAATIVYFLMRRDVDEIDATEVDVGDDDDDPFPNFATTPPVEKKTTGLNIIESPTPPAPPSPFPQSEQPSPPPPAPPSSFPHDPDAPHGKS